MEDLREVWEINVVVRCKKGIMDTPFDLVSTYPCCDSQIGVKIAPSSLRSLTRGLGDIDYD